MTTVILKKCKEESLLRFHPWVFSGAIERVILDRDYSYSSPREGERVKVVSHGGDTLGVGHFQVGSIAVRMLWFGSEPMPRTFWSDRIRSAYELRLKAGLIRKDNTMCRLLHGEGDFVPGLVADIYGDTAVVQAHSAGMHLERKEIAQAIVEQVEPIRQVYYKSDDTLPFKADLQGDKVGWLIKGKKEQAVYTAVENGLEFGIDFLGGQKTGFFIDQRNNRSLLEHYAMGRDVLNMFCYTGGFSVYALRGGANLVHSVDVSERAVKIVNENISRNFPDCTRHQAFAREAFEYMADIKDKYDLIVLDPPAFAKHRDAVRNALRGYQKLNAKAFEQIRSGGILFTFSCSQAVDKEQFRLAVFSAAAQTGRRVRILHQLHQPEDHPVNIYHPEGEYLKGLVLYVE